MNGQKTTGFVSHRGLKYPMSYSRENIEFAIDYKPSDSDIFVITYPKSGTTWTQQIIYLILNDGKPFDDNNFINNSCLEYKGSQCKRYPLIKSHLPFNLLPYNPKTKYFYVVRNPKDVCLSYYNHMKCLFGYDFTRFFDYFISGQLPYGDFFDHLISYNRNRFDNNFCLLVYEQMIANPRDTVLKIANFLGDKYGHNLMRENQLILNKVLQQISFDSMRNQLKDNEYIFGKGMVGQWRQLLTLEQSFLVDHKFKLYCNGTDFDDLSSQWQPIIEWQ